MRNLIKLILEDEVNRKYDRPTPKIEQLVYRWLNDYFDGAKMYHDKSWETRHDFEWCNDGKEIMSVILFFHDDENVFDDKRKTEERDFEDGELQIPKDIFDELNSDIPVRKYYLTYVIQDWFEDTFLETIQNKMGRNDISIDDFSEHPKKSQVCVPPVSKPEGVTDDEMIDFIVKNTLFRKDELEKRIIDEREWLEKLYTDKVRSSEIDRVRGSRW
jgi:hypothetical protein